MTEIIDIVDKNDNLVGKAERKEAVSKGLRHRVSRVIVKDKRDCYLLSKRSKTKDKFPGFSDIGMGETLQSGEDYKTAALRGLHEELGIRSTKKKLRFLFKFSYSSRSINTNYEVFILSHSGKIRIQKEEIDNAEFLPLHVIKMTAGKLTPPARLILKKFLEGANAKR